MSALLPILLLGLTANLEPGTLVVFVALLGTDRPRRNALAFLAGWCTSLAVVFLVSYAFLGGQPPVSGSTEDVVVRIAEIVVAAILAWVAVREWRRRHDTAGSGQPRSAGWLTRLGPRTAFFAAMWEQPWTVTMAAAMVVVRAHLGLAETAAAFVVFAIASTALIGTVWLGYRADPARAQALLRRAEIAVRARGPRVFAVVAAVAALAFLADGVYGLAQR
jgi:threonine/homoserine/homoserine lactone efflux protein